MKKLYLLISLFISTAGNVFAMDKQLDKTGLKRNFSQLDVPTTGIGLGGKQYIIDGIDSDSDDDETPRLTTHKQFETATNTAIAAKSIGKAATFMYSWLKLFDSGTSDLSPSHIATVIASHTELMRVANQFGRGSKLPNIRTINRKILALNGKNLPQTPINNNNNQ